MFIKHKEYFINLDNITQIHLNDDEIHFAPVCDPSFVLEFDSEEGAKEAFDAIYDQIGRRNTILDLDKTIEKFHES